jgi:hypothetical protein
VRRKTEYGNSIDGEIVALDEKCRSSFRYCKVSTWSKERPPVVFYAFDLLQLNGKNLRDLPKLAAADRTAGRFQGLAHRLISPSFSA